MATDPTSELVRFHEFLDETLRSGLRLSPEEALDLWRQRNPATDDFQDTVVALREAIAEMDAGDTGQPFEDFDREFRMRHGLS
jgi:hypothetical protein